MVPHSDGLQVKPQTISTAFRRIGGVDVAVGSDARERVRAVPLGLAVLGVKRREFPDCLNGP